MANVNWDIANVLGVAAGQSSVDEDQTLKVPHSTDPSCAKRAGDLVVGDSYLHGSTVYRITAVL